MVEHRFEDAADAFERAVAAFSASVEVFAGHPTAPAELAEARALREVAVLVSQAVRDRASFRWEPSHQGWQAGRDRLDEAAAVRGRDFGEVAAVVNAMLGEARGTLADLEHARLRLADGQQALAERDAGRYESFRLPHVSIESHRTTAQPPEPRRPGPWTWTI
jgi:hypothetical protein